MLSRQPDEPALQPGHEGNPPIVMVNPFAGLELPTIRPGEIVYLEHEEAAALYEAVEKKSHRTVPVPPAIMAGMSAGPAAR
jgi:hypothetical protein